MTRCPLPLFPILPSPSNLTIPTLTLNSLPTTQGSNTWGNYRHQADACHAYQILIKNGYKAKNIITMMYDDIAQNQGA